VCGRGAAIAYLAALSIGFPFLDYRATLMIGLIGGVPAAVCSWLSDKSMRSETQISYGIRKS
jgi:hypothetical protein